MKLRIFFSHFRMVVVERVTNAYQFSGGVIGFGEAGEGKGWQFSGEVIGFGRARF